MAMQPDEYRWSWDYQVRQIFGSFNPAPRRALTVPEIDTYVKYLVELDNDIKNKDTTPLTEAKLDKHVIALKKGYGQWNLNTKPVLAMPPKNQRKQTLDALYPAGSMPTDAQIKAARGRLGVQPQSQKPKGRPQIADPAAPPRNLQPNNNITLAANPPSIYESIKDANIRSLIRETKDASYDPEQTFEVTIGDPAGGAAAGYPINVNLTPIQYAALAGLKGTVRLLLQTKGDTTKKINGKTIVDAIETYRKGDNDKNEVKYIFEVVNVAIRDATDDFSVGLQIDPKYGEGLTKDVDKKLAKTIYEREYKDLQNPQPLPATAKKPTTSLTEDAKKKGKEDGELGSSMNPEYNTKTPQEKEAYGKEYDKARAKFQGEKDALMGEPDMIGTISNELSEYYRGPAPVQAHVTEVNKIYKDAYEANKDKSADLAKETGYVGKPIPSEAVLSGNYFGFGSELNNIVGFDFTPSESGKETENKYQEGFAEFLKQYTSLVGQAKYAGYTDGLKKNAKYTSLGKVIVNNKQYPVDFGKLNTNIKTQPEIGNNQPVLNDEYDEAQTYLRDLKTRVNDPVITPEQLILLFKNLEGVRSDTIKQLLQPIASSQRGGTRGTSKDESGRNLGNADKDQIEELIQFLENRGVPVGIYTTALRDAVKNNNNQFALNALFDKLQNKKNEILSSSGTSNAVTSTSAPDDGEGSAATSNAAATSATSADSSDLDRDKEELKQLIDNNEKIKDAFKLALKLEVARAKTRENLNNVRNKYLTYFRQEIVSDIDALNFDDISRKDKKDIEKTFPNPLKSIPLDQNVLTKLKNRLTTLLQMQEERKRNTTAAEEARIATAKALEDAERALEADRPRIEAAKVQADIEARRAKTDELLEAERVAQKKRETAVSDIETYTEKRRAEQARRAQAEAAAEAAAAARREEGVDVALEEAEAAPAAPVDPLQERKGQIKLNIDRLEGIIGTDGFKSRLDRDGENLDQLENDVSAAIADSSAPIQRKIEALPDGERKLNLNERLTRDILAVVNVDVDKSTEINTEINKIQDQATKNLMLGKFNDLDNNLEILEREVDKEVIQQEKNLTNKTKLVRKEVTKIKNINAKQQLNDRIYRQGITLEELDNLLTEIQIELQKEKVQQKIDKLPAGTTKQAFQTRLNTEDENITGLEVSINSWTILQKEILRQIWYIPDTQQAEKDAFLARVNNPNATLDDLIILQHEIQPFVPSWAKIVKEKSVDFAKAVSTTTATGVRLTAKGATVVAQALGTGATAVAQGLGTGATAVKQGLGAAGTFLAEKATALGTGVVTGLGSVSTKQQLYEKVKQALSVIPKFKQVVTQDIPRGVKPDDPSLDITVNVPKRLQLLYDREFERGFKEGSRKSGGTKRREKESQRVTRKKQRSKK